ncbi:MULTISPECIES: hypothetical protein [unclassified Pseudoalteromonas]|uniref:hypothetical protein n=1 Tax=unclassified Pseudoalteromonas TaxID=194690 RepID=UPI0030149B66
MKLRLKKKPLKSLRADQLQRTVTQQIAAGEYEVSKIDCNSWQVCNTHPAICESLGMCPS